MAASRPSLNGILVLVCAISCLPLTYSWYNIKNIMPSAHNSRPKPCPYILPATADASASAQVQDAEAYNSLDSIMSLQHLPKLIVFDLDNTLWTPELYQIRLKNPPPRANRDVRLFPEAIPILEFLYAHDFDLAIASRTSKTDWAHQLLDDFIVVADDDLSLKSLFAHIVIQTGSKKQHMAKLKSVAQVHYSDMLFIDDDARMNLDEVSQLGVLCCHTPRGITMEHFVKALHKYNELKKGHVDGHWMGYILNNDNLGIKRDESGDATNNKKNNMELRECQGRVKFYSAPKKFGFVVDDATREEFFVHESKVPASMRLQTGDRVRFQATQDSSGRAAAIILSSATTVADATAAASSSSSATTGNSNRKTSTRTTKAATSDYAASSVATTKSTSRPEARLTTRTETTTTTMSMKCFSMSQPFASLLLNGCKTVESRNNPMFADLAPGTRLLVHCGQRDWHDVTSYRQYLMQRNNNRNDGENHADNDGEDDDETRIAKVSRLRPGFSKGSIIGVVTIGKTWRATEQQRQGYDLQRRVLAPYEGIGKFCTEIREAQWLKRPIPMRGSGGVYTVEIPEDCLP